ncbi:MAG: hypothetical protein ABR548_05145 [Actinomycetota bacterium]|nr:hypothetical protein [Actinomycetota bacterium]
MDKLWRALDNRQRLAASAVGVGFLVTLGLGIWAAGDSPPNGAQSALLVVLGGLFQVGGAGYFYRSGRSDPSLARSTVRKLAAMTSRARDAEQLAESGFDSANAAELRKITGRLSVHLSYLREDLELTIHTWREIHPGALRDLVEGDTVD